MPDQTIIDTLLLHFPDGRITGGGVAIRCRCGRECWAWNDEVHGPISAENNTWLVAERRHAEHTLAAARAAALTTDSAPDVDPVPILEEVARLDGELHDMRTRAEKAEQERDEALAGVRVLARDNIEAYERAEKAEQETNAEAADERVAKAEQERNEADRARRDAEATVKRYGETIDGFQARVAELEGMTARELLDAAWEAAHVPEDGIIPDGAEYLERYADGCLYGPTATRIDLPGQGDDAERRLLDPPAPKRPAGAEAVQTFIDAFHEAGEFTLTGKLNGAPLADFLASRGVRVTEDGAS